MLIVRVTYAEIREALERKTKAFLELANRLDEDAVRIEGKPLDVSRGAAYTGPSSLSEGSDLRARAKTARRAGHDCRFIVNRLATPDCLPPEATTEFSITLQEAAQLGILQGWTFDNDTGI